MHKHLKYFRPHAKPLIIVFAVLLLEMGFASAVPYSFAILVDRALLGGETSVMIWVLSGLGVGAVVVSLAGLGRDKLFARVSSELLNHIRVDLFTHLQKLSMSFYSRVQVGDIMSRFSGDFSVIEDIVDGIIPWALLPSLDVIANTVLLFVLDWRLALLAMLVWPFALLGPRKFAPYVSEASLHRREQEGGTLTAVQENLGAQPVVKAFGLDERMVGDFKTLSDILAKSMRRVTFFSALVDRSSQTGVMILQVVLMGVGVYMVSQGALTIGTLGAFQALFLSMSSSLGYVTSYVPNLLEAGASLKRIEEVLDEVPSVTDAPTAIVAPKLERAFTFDNVSFSYSGDTLNLKNATLELPRGRSAAFVGGSGSGKSTLLNLLIRFYDPKDGAVKIDGVDIRDVTLASLHGQMSFVFQDSFLFNTTVKENIRLGRLDATDDEIIAAAKVAEIHDVIMAMPNTYDTIVGERGGKLSGGQRQRISIARAMLRDPKILILDEATSALDPGTEASINATLDRVGRGRTIIQVTHRLASIANVDKIVVLDKGAIMEQGPHEELLKLGGIYFKLWQKQSGFHVSDDGEEAEITHDRLRALPIFATLDEDLLEEVSQHLSTEKVPADRLVMQEGDPGDHLYIIVRGKVEVIKNMPDGTARKVAELQDGDHFGEVVLLQAVPRTATVRTIDPCVFLTLRRKQFAHLLEKAPQVRKTLEDIFEQRIREEKR